MEKTKKSLSKSMGNLTPSPPSPPMAQKSQQEHSDDLQAPTSRPRFRLLTFSTSRNTPKKRAKKLMKQSNGYGSYSNLFRAQSYDSLCLSSSTTIKERHHNDDDGEGKISP